MTSMTTSQQTDRSGADEIPGPRGGHGVRLLVLGADPDAQDLRAQAQAAGYELAQRYSARVSHVAYGSGIDPEDARYAKIRDSGLALLPLQKCAEQLGLGADVDEAEGVDAVDVEAVGPESESEPEADVRAVAATEPGAEPEPALEAEPEPEIDDEPLAFPPLHATSAAEPETLEELEARERLYDHEVEFAFVPGFTDEPADLGVPLAAAVLGADPWEGDQDQPAPEEPAEPASQQTSHDASPETSPEAPQDTAPQDTTPQETAPHATTPQQPNPHPGLGRVVLSVLWALIPLATFGLLSPVTFGYAAYRLRSRGLALTALVYTLAVVVSFILSAIRPHSVTPADTTGALLTICLAGTWIGGTLHALSLRTRVFVN
jgi:hypothetical protein